MDKNILEEFRKISGLNEVFSSEPLHRGDDIIFKDRYMNKGLKGIIKKVLDNNKYDIEYYLTTGRKESGVKDGEDLEKVSTNKPKKSSVKKKKDTTDYGLLGKVVKILPGREPREWDKYIGEYGRIEGEYESTYIVAVLSGDEPIFYIPKQYLQLTER